MDWLGEAVAELSAHARSLGTFFLLEPLNRYETVMLRTVSDAADLISRHGITGCKVLADLFHMNIEEASIDGTLRQHGSLIGHVHWADSNRRAVGLGHTDAAPVAAALREMGYDGYVSAEVFPQPDPAAAAHQSQASFQRWFRGER